MDMDREHDEATVRSDAEAMEFGKTSIDLWLDKINLAKAEEKAWRDNARNAIKIYEADDDADTVFNLYHSNVDTLVPALYNTTPIPDIRRRYGDDDEQARHVSEILERGLSYSVDQYKFDDVIKNVVRASRVIGRGIPRLRYEPRIGQEQDHEGKPVEVIVEQTVQCEVVPWDRFIRGPGRSWGDVPWIAFEHDLTEEEVGKFVQDPARLADLKFGANENSLSDEKDDAAKTHKGVYKTIKVYEIWDKATRSVGFATDQDKEHPLHVEEDPLGLKGFFPTPEPLMATKRLTGLVPVVPYQIVKKLMKELDRVTNRINALVEQLKVRGLYDSKMDEEFKLLQDASDGEYIPAKSAEEFVAGASRGLSDAVHHWPLQETVVAIEQLSIRQDQIKQTLYEITGVSDILRGATDARETAEAQKIKSTWGNQRITEMQDEVAELVRELFRMKTEIMAKHFETNVLSRMTGQQIDEEVEQLLRDEYSSYRIDIETNSTIRADMSSAQEETSQLLTGTAQILDAITRAAPVTPQLVPALVTMLASFTRKFNLDKKTEDAIEQMIEQGEAAAQHAQEQSQQGQQGPSPEEMQMQQKQAEMQMQQQIEQADHEREKAELERQVKMLEMQEAQAQREHDAQMREVELQTAMIEAQSKQEVARAAIEKAGLSIEQVKEQAKARKAEAAARPEGAKK